MRNSENIIGDLIVKRRAVGPKTSQGRVLSNLIEQCPWLNDTTGDRSWAQHPTQQMPWMMNVSIEALAK